MKKYCSLGGRSGYTSKLKLIKGLLQNQPLSVANFYSPELQAQLDSRLAEGDIHAIVCTASSMAEYVFRSKTLGYLTTKGKRPKLVMDFMDLDSDKWAQYEQLKPFPLSLIYTREKKLLKKYEQRIYDFFDACLFISQDEINLFSKSLPNNQKLHCVGNGIDTTFYTPANKAKPAGAPPVLLFTGVMDYLPNEDAVIWFAKEILAGIRKQHPAAQFVIAGMNPSKAVMRLANIPGVVITGFVEDIREYYHQADIFVAPFRLARGVQNKVLQAFACGLPVVTTPMGNEGINAVDGEECIITPTVEGFIAAVNSLLKEPEQRQAIGNNALQKALKDFSWRAQIEKLENILVDENH